MFLFLHRASRLHDVFGISVEADVVTTWCWKERLTDL